MRSFIISTVCISAFLITGADQVFSQDSWNMELIGKAAYDGFFRNYLAYNDHLFIATTKDCPGDPYTHVFSVVDMSDPAHPRRIRTVYEGERRIQDFLLVDTLLYMSLEYEGVIIYDIQDPSLPVELANLEENQDFGYLLKRFGDYIGSMHQRSFKIIDISDRLNPQLISSIERELFDIYDFEFYGDYLLLSDGFEVLQDFRLDIYDISDISNPTNVSFTSIDSTWFGVNLSVVENYVYLYNTEMGHQIYDISEPGEPEFVRAFLDNFLILDIEISGNILFASRFDDAILTMDISDPVNPIITNEFEVQSVRSFSRNVLSLSGDNLYFIAADNVMSLLDVNNPDSPRLLGRYFAGARAYRPAKWMNYVYFCDLWSGLRIVDMSDPTAPVGVNCRYSYGSSYLCFIFNDLLFFTGHADGVQIFSLDDPLNPEPISTVTESHNAGYLYVSDTLLYIPRGNGFLIIDISDPGNPQELTDFNTDYWNNHVFAITVSGSYAYTAENYYGIGIYDISDPLIPVKIGGFEDSSFPLSVFYKEDILYVADAGDGFLTIDVSDPANPSRMGIGQCEEAQDVFVEGELAYVADNMSDFKVFNVSDPYSPELIATYDDFGIGNGVYVENDTAYVSARNGGFWILGYSETVGIEDEAIKPGKFQLDQNHPNPFNAKTVLNYSLPESGVVTLSIYNILGQQVMTLFVGEKAAGKHTIAWDASTFPSGVYFARLETMDVSKTIKMVLLK